MTRAMKNTLLFTALMALMAPLSADTIKVDMAPGLWENKVTYSGAGMAQIQQTQRTQMEAALAEMKKQFAAMPEEQRKQMEALMEQTGMKVSEEGMTFNNNKVSVSADGITAKSCVTQAQIDSGKLGINEQDDCSFSLTQVSKNRYKSLQECTGDQPSRSESDIVFTSPKHFTGTGKMTQALNGTEQTVEIALEGRWQSSDCGDLEPDEDY
jgi:Spy/CpxP family protein refolding chaperone